MIYQEIYGSDSIKLIDGSRESIIPNDPTNLSRQQLNDWLLVEGNNLIPADIPATPEPIYNWAGFDDQLVSVLDPDSAYRQLTAWAKTTPAFLDCKGNISNAVMSQNLDRLQFAFSDLKQTAIAPNTFTSTQITEINSCLETLGVAWRWENL